MATGMAGLSGKGTAAAADGQLRWQLRWIRWWRIAQGRYEGALPRVRRRQHPRTPCTRNPSIHHGASSSPDRRPPSGPRRRPRYGCRCGNTRTSTYSAGERVVGSTLGRGRWEGREAGTIIIIIIISSSRRHQHQTSTTTRRRVRIQCLNLSCAPFVEHAPSTDDCVLSMHRGSI